MTRTRRRRGPGEGAVYQRADGIWVGSVELGWHGGKRRRRYVYAKTHREISRKIGRLADAARQGQISPTRVPKVSEWMRIYLSEVASTAVRPSSLHRYEQEVRLYIDPDLGRLKLDKIRPQHLTTFYRHQLETLSPGSVRRLHALIRSSLTVAVRWGIIATNPAMVVPAPPLSQREVHPLTVDEVHRLLTAARETTLFPRWLLAIMLGMRQGEVLGLSWDDVDLEQSLLRVRQTAATPTRRLARPRAAQNGSIQTYCGPSALGRPGSVGSS